MRILACMYFDNITRGIGASLKFDEETLKGNFGHYVIILIDLLDSLIIDMEEHKFFVTMVYEKL